MSTHKVDDDIRHAKRFLNLFQEKARDIKLKNDFIDAAITCYGKSFDIIVDMNGRMFFYCMACEKELNCTKSLQSHAGSGSHLKRAAADNDRSSYAVKTNLRTIGCTLSTALLSELEKCTVEIVGLQKLQEYTHVRSGRCYYICTLCHAHGKLDDMVKHFIGDKHTDKYIKSVLVLKNSDITAVERTYLRRKLYDAQGYTYLDIVKFTDRRLYPYILENEGKSASYRKKTIGAYNSDKMLSHPSSSETDIDVKSSIKSESSSASEVKCSVVDIVSVTQGTQTDDDDKFNKMMSNIQTLVLTHHLPESDIVNIEDFRICLIITFALLHLLFFVVKGKCQLSAGHRIKFEDEIKFPEMEIIKKCMGTMKKNFEEILNKKYQMGLDLSHRPSFRQ